MRASTILFVLGAAILAVIGVTTALDSGEIDKSTQENHRLLRSGSMEQEPDEERKFIKVPSFMNKAAREAKKAKKKAEIANLVWLKLQKYSDSYALNYVDDMVKSGRSADDEIKFLKKHMKVSNNLQRVIEGHFRSHAELGRVLAKPKYK
uniref:Secreted RxLR effector protein 3 n=1 Tax=Plasmopara viticola TaxID=143451 RepID=RLR3_PLAVT|nr:RecName: Full=Secreted RxLR effector protein 3; Flags: Precursor [Plasmopara viticola]